MASGEGKATKKVFTCVEAILEELERESDAGSCSDASYDSEVEAAFLEGEDPAFDGADSNEEYEAPERAQTSRRKTRGKSSTQGTKYPDEALKWNDLNVEDVDPVLPPFQPKRIPGPQLAVDSFCLCLTARNHLLMMVVEKSFEGCIRLFKREHEPAVRSRQPWPKRHQGQRPRPDRNGRPPAPESKPRS
ncbi:hypothetical protein G5714_002703 [Onychostoma macrolepis]|uniref:Uncharacterized protein n=1 Tax=Onychostoma macrolepis TaxID=369639 RepID=A0A7J6D8J9_9TELE|nr:hypothetical protein G5714_002703 [Onychostoma macrolepis]